MASPRKRARTKPLTIHSFNGCKSYDDNTLTKKEKKTATPEKENTPDQEKTKSPVKEFPFMNTPSAQIVNVHRSVSSTRLRIGTSFRISIT